MNIGRQIFTFSVQISSPRLLFNLIPADEACQENNEYWQTFMNNVYY